MLDIYGACLGEVIKCLVFMMGHSGRVMDMLSVWLCLTVVELFSRVVFKVHVIGKVIKMLNIHFAFLNESYLIVEH